MKVKEFDLILQEGEGYSVEFKSEFSKLDREMVAFANASGGRIFLGVADDKSVPGIRLTNRLKSQIVDIARNCDPPIDLTVTGFRNVAIVDVKEGANKPYQ